MVSLLDYFSSFNDFIVRHNDSYVNNHLISDKVYLDNVLKDDDPNISLDEEQRRVVLSDEDYTLVVAGAGAGKTTTIEAKVKYLVDIKHIDPQRILIVSFTRKATKELKDRINKRLKINACISTFHSIGNTIIKNEEENKYKIVDVGFMFDAIKNYLVNKLDDEYFINKIVLFFSSYLNISFSSKDTSLLFKELNKNNFVTLRSDLENIIERYKGELDKKRITLNDERVRSNDELRIANFLYINGIDYEYEPVYRFGFKRSIKPYCPDFLLRQGDKEVYLEHFGLSEDGKNSRFTKEEIEKYKEERNPVFFSNKKGGEVIRKLNFREFMKVISFNITYIGSFAIWEEDCDAIANDVENCDLLLWQVGKFLKLASQAKEVNLFDYPFGSIQNVEKKNISYGLYQVFYKNYFHILQPYFDNKELLECDREFLERDLLYNFFLIFFLLYHE